MGLFRQNCICKTITHMASSGTLRSWLIKITLHQTKQREREIRTFIQASLRYKDVLMGLEIYLQFLALPSPSPCIAPAAWYVLYFDQGWCFDILHSQMPIVHLQLLYLCYFEQGRCVYNIHSWLFFEGFCSSMISLLFSGRVISCEIGRLLDDFFSEFLCCDQWSLSLSLTGHMGSTFFSLYFFGQ